MARYNDDDRDAGLQDLFDHLPGVSHFRDYERDISYEMYERGFTHDSSEPGYDPDEAREAREEFFEYTGLPEELFPWDEWRELMGYDD